MVLNKIYNEDARVTLSRMPDNFCDAVITSPPYNMNLRIRNGKYCSRQIVKEMSTKYEGFSDNLPINEFYELHAGILRELLRVSRLIFYNIQIVTGSKRAFFKIMGEFNEYLKDVIVWDKINAEPAMCEGVLNRQTELLLVFDNENAISRKFEVFNPGRGNLSDIWKIKRQRSITDRHGAVFPEELVKNILTNFTNPGAVIYDPFSGSGTVAKVAVEIGRYFIASEISAEYCEITRNRLTRYIALTENKNLEDCTT